MKALTSSIYLYAWSRLFTYIGIFNYFSMLSSKGLNLITHSEYCIDESNHWTFWTFSIIARQSYTSIVLESLFLKGLLNINLYLIRNNTEIWIEATYDCGMFFAEVIVCERIVRNIFSESTKTFDYRNRFTGLILNCIKLAALKHVVYTKNFICNFHHTVIWAKHSLL